MITLTYGVSGAAACWSRPSCSRPALLNATTQTRSGASSSSSRRPAPSSAYLTVSEIFPLELRGQAISYFFAIAQGIGGSAAPSIFGHLIGGQNNPHPDRTPLSWGFAIGGVIMMVGGLVAWFLAVDAERKVTGGHRRTADQGEGHRRTGPLRYLRRAQLPSTTLSLSLLLSGPGPRPGPLFWAGRDLDPRRG